MLRYLSESQRITLYMLHIHKNRYRYIQAGCQMLRVICAADRAFVIGSSNFSFSSKKLVGKKAESSSNDTWTVNGHVSLESFQRIPPFDRTLHRSKPIYHENESASILWIIQQKTTGKFIVFSSIPIDHPLN